MVVGMISRSTFDFYQSLLNFRDLIVGVEDSHHVDPDNFDGTRLGDVGPVLVCHVEISPKFA